ncbi:uncharacterized protein LOC124815973 [Hydra vulgaris]|uniref:uncharacterized protein LOC124815973 n=1 Tax=Hydra vulgaris TaxID=6087 RepID=UPI001F5FD165|nr:uncharacterized protein LOC124815973 [Hydra vulgaris]
MHSSILTPISIIFCKSFCSNSVPNSWKLANITSINKKGQKTNSENYRTISIICKIIKQLVRDTMLKHLLSKNLLDANQHGFTPSKSCLTNLFESFDLITHAMESRYDVVVLLDFAKHLIKLITRYLKKFVRVVLTNISASG